MTEIEVDRMQECWIEFCKTKNIDQRESCCDPEISEMWFDYVSKNYHQPIEASPWDN